MKLTAARSMNRRPTRRLTSDSLTVAFPVRASSSGIGTMSSMDSSTRSSTTESFTLWANAYDAARRSSAEAVLSTTSSPLTLRTQPGEAGARWGV